MLAVIFISHMVQMKVKYIYPVLLSFMLLYIPHGSDERLSLPLASVATNSLYIPHGSDESENNRKSNQVSWTLYPTWFRWKLKTASLIKKSLKLYIPHGSDESLILNFLKRALYQLYIPHGSDESVEVWVTSSTSTTFISHMVQMKVNWRGT